MRENRVPHKRFECIRGLLIYMASNFKWMMPYLKGLHPTIDEWTEEQDKDFYKIKSQPRVRMEIWEWGHEDWTEERELQVLRINKDKTATEWIYPEPRFREDMLALKRITAPEKPAVTRCQEPESMTDFYLLEDASGQGFGSGL